jgi:hypothetical protein
VILSLALTIEARPVHTGPLSASRGVRDRTRRAPGASRRSTGRLASGRLPPRRGQDRDSGCGLVETRPARSC